MKDILIGPWNTFLMSELQKTKDTLRVISPFISKDGIDVLLEGLGRGISTRLITRCNSSDFISRVNSAHALKSLVDSSGRIRVQDRYLHSKLYLFDSRLAVVSSSNLTYAGLNKNAEIGIVIRNPSMLQTLEDHFEYSWDKLSEDLDKEDIQSIIDHIKQLTHHLEGNGQPSPEIRDWGKHLSPNEEDLGQESEKRYTPSTTGGSKHWIKFIWRRKDPAPIDREIEAIAKYQGAVTFPSHPGHPRNIQSGHSVYHTAIAKTYRGNDWLVYGRGIVASDHRDGIDEFPKHLLSKYTMIARYPYLIWLDNIELIGGRIQDGISLHDLFRQLRDETFVRSVVNANRGEHNTFKKVMRRQSHLELTPTAVTLLNEKMERAFATYGKITENKGTSVWWNGEDNQKHQFHRV